DMDKITLIWYPDPAEENIFSLDNLQKMKRFEDQLFNLPTYQNQLCKLQADGTCTPFQSAVQYLIGSQANYSIRLNARVGQLFITNPFFFESQYLTNNYINTYTRTIISIGGPLAGYDTTDGDRYDAQHQKALNLIKQEMLPMIMEKAF